MKYHGCVLDFTDKRNEELMKAFRQTISTKSFIDITEISEIIVNTPCSRFWVSEERALVVIAAMLKGKPVLNTMRSTKREMFQEIHKRVIDLRKKYPDKTLFELVIKVVNSPAQKFYMRPRCAMEIIYKIKREFYKKQKRRY